MKSGTASLSNLNTFLYLFLSFLNRLKKLAFSLTIETISCTQCGTPNPSFFLLLIKGGILGEAVSV